MRGIEVQLLDQDRQVGRILVETSWPGRTFAQAVPPAVVGQDLEPLGEEGNHELPSWRLA